jgi:hypothetical protein
VLAATTSVERLQSFLVVDVQPVRAERLGFLREGGHHPLPEALAAFVRVHGGLQQERVCRAVPDHVAETDQPVVPACGDPGVSPFGEIAELRRRVVRPGRGVQLVQLGFVQRLVRFENDVGHVAPFR